MGKLRTKNGHDFFECSSLLQKSLRRGDIVYAARAANELMPKYSNYVWNRLLVVSAEDCNDLVTGEVLGLCLAWSKVVATSSTESKAGSQGHPIFVYKAIVLLAKCRHSRDADELHHLLVKRLPDDEFEAAVKECTVLEDDGSFEIPAWVFDKHTMKGKRSGATLEDFLRDEHDALTDRTSIFSNFDDMVESWGYHLPEFDWPEGEGK